MNILLMTPTGEIKISAVEALVNVAFAGDVAVTAQADLAATKLEDFKQLLGHFSQEEIKTALRLKTKEEDIAPFCAALLARRPLQPGQDADARTKQDRVRHSEIRTLFAETTRQPLGWLDTFPGWQIAVDAARKLAKQRKEQAEQVARDAEIGLRRMQLEREIGDVSPEAMLLAKEQAEAEINDAHVNAKVDKAIEKLSKSAEELGFALLPLSETMQTVAELLVTRFGYLTCFTLADHLQDTCDRIKLAQDEAALAKAESEQINNEAVKAEIAAHQAEQQAEQHAA